MNLPSADSFLIKLLRISSTTRKRYGAQGHHWRTPCPMLKDFVLLQFTLTHALASVNKIRVILGVVTASPEQGLLVRRLTWPFSVGFGSSWKVGIFFPCEGLSMPILLQR